MQEGTFNDRAARYMVELDDYIKRCEVALGHLDVDHAVPRKFAGELQTLIQRGRNIHLGYKVAVARPDTDEARQAELVGDDARWINDFADLRKRMFAAGEILNLAAADEASNGSSKASNSKVSETMSQVYDRLNPGAK